MRWFLVGYNCQICGQTHYIKLYWTEKFEKQYKKDFGKDMLKEEMMFVDDRLEQHVMQIHNMNYKNFYPERVIKDQRKLRKLIPDIYEMYEKAIGNKPCLTDA